ncbi:hypothetical protein HCU64_14760 [Methylobacterium sp. C25]|uniref:hypothetical protein n=1 Tax=Methylobacterium sp. C25 TaxID=2721622 RepID=UPI001F19475D|nr:hypothetical protein [Methylobacterium sp. C25]MCE4225019.1 hypothetical protein [Methylobacterium sp. C25]
MEGSPTIEIPRPLRDGGICNPSCEISSFEQVDHRAEEIVEVAAAYFEPFVGAAAIRIGSNCFADVGGASPIGLSAEARLSKVFGTGMSIMVRALVGCRRAYGDVVP